ncbi:MAG: hypothetical protein AAGC63_16310 [Propionicimonas sp.]
MLPVTILVRQSLTTSDVWRTLAAATGRPPRQVRERPLRGCLVAQGGCGFIFLDEDDPASIRFALAHELAHFAGHYLGKRELAIARMGPSIAPVLDGRRAPTAEERLGGILSGCPLGTFTDVLEREGDSPLTPAAEAMEFEADEVAFLALAPIGMVIAETLRRQGVVQSDSVVDTLTQAFGLSQRDARRHAPRILNAVQRSKPSLVDRLREAASRTRGERHR